MGAAPPDKAERTAGEDDETIDPATLPPLESLGPESDYTVFLKKGVPEALRIAALRKAWMSDPFIRDFRGPAEYALDYTTPEFDLRPTDDVAKMLGRLFPPKAPAAAEPAAPPASATGGQAEPAAEMPPVAPSLPPNSADPPPAPTAAEPVPPALSPPTPSAGRRRKHGGALPDKPA